MILKKLIPSPVEIGREVIIVIAGALVAALVVGYTPGLKAWITRQWDGANR